MSDIKAGDVVVCVDASPRANTRPDQMEVIRRWLREGALYRAKGYVETWDGTPGLLIDQMEPHVAPDGGTEGFDPTRFRKIDPADEQFSDRIRACRPIRQREAA